MQFEDEFDKQQQLEDWNEDMQKARRSQQLIQQLEQEQQQQQAAAEQQKAVTEILQAEGLSPEDLQNIDPQILKDAYLKGTKKYAKKIKEKIGRDHKGRFVRQPTAAQPSLPEQQGGYNVTETSRDASRITADRQSGKISSDKALEEIVSLFTGDFFEKTLKR